MKKQSAPQEAKYFKYKFTTLLILLSIAVLLLCVAAIVVSIYQISRFGVQQPLDVFKYPFLIGVSIFCIVIVVSLLIKSQYIVDNAHITTQFGFIKSKTDIKTITVSTIVKIFFAIILPLQFVLNRLHTPLYANSPYIRAELSKFSFKIGISPVDMG